MNEKIIGSYFNEKGKRRKIPEYKAWVNMKTRCNDPNFIQYENYGGRGIIVCGSWISDFQQFYIDMGKRPSDKHSLDRIDNNGNYKRDNCRWATKIEQNNNRSVNIYVEYEGENVSIEYITTKSEHSYGILYDRIVKYGWDVRRAINEPLIHKLSDSDVITIRSLKGIETQKETAKRYGLSNTMISHIQTFRCYKDVN